MKKCVTTIPGSGSAVASPWAIPYSPPEPALTIESQADGLGPFLERPISAIVPECVPLGVVGDEEIDEVVAVVLAAITPIPLPLPW